MRPKLKEDPREWRKFAVVLLAVIWIGTGLLWHRGVLGSSALPIVGLLSLCLAALAMLRPRGIRPIYRVAMTFGFYMGQAVGKVILTATFILVVTPIGMILRLLGKDLLRLRRSPQAASHWLPARPASRLDRQF